MTRDIMDIIKELGFETIGTTDAGNLEFNPMVREMCKANTCHQYGANWACPPACGDLEHFRDLIADKTTCYVFETWGELEDDFDIETMRELGDTHNKRTNRLAVTMSREHPRAIVLGAGFCTICPKCTYPDEPCRYPDFMYSAMEAAGLVVADVCRAADIPYNHGPQTMAYVGCVVA